MTFIELPIGLLVVITFVLYSIKNTNMFFKSVIFLLFIQGPFELLGFGSYVKRILEVLIYIYFFDHLFKNRIKRYPLLTVIAAIIIVSIISSAVNENLNLYYYSFLRIFLTKYFIFLIAYNLYIGEKQFKEINKYLFAFAILQIVFSIFVKYPIYGLRENIVGTITATGGALNTIFPLIAIAFTVSYYLYVKKHITVLALIPFFILIGWLGGKRGIYFYLIIVSIFMYIFYNMYEGRKVSAIFDGKSWLAIICLVLLLARPHFI